jgi:two-component system, NarL family, sensor histidine kinase UhpB
LVSSNSAETAGAETAGAATAAERVAKETTSDTPVTREMPDVVRRLLGLPIVYKVLFANAAIVMLGAVAGTWVTIEMVRRAPNGTHYGLAIIFVVAGIILSVIVNFLVLRAAFQPLAVLERAALAVKDGDLSARASDGTFTDPQIAHLAETFNATLDELARDRSELRSLASQVVRAQEEERKRISRELHDDTAQILFAQVLRLTALKGSADPGVQETAAKLEAMTVEALEGVRRLALELRPPALDDLGLLAALGDLAQRFSDQTGIPVDYRPTGLRGRMPAETELVLYRIAQEALMNVAKHAQASRVRLDLDRSENEVTLSVRDDGTGFDLASASTRDDRGVGLGLFGMEERAHLVGGSLRIDTAPGMETHIFAQIPFDHDIRADNE